MNQGLSEFIVKSPYEGSTSSSPSVAFEERVKRARPREHESSVGQVVPSADRYLNSAPLIPI